LFHFFININALNFFLMLEVIGNFTLLISFNAVCNNELIDFRRNSFFPGLLFFSLI